jgi:outer membrane receptor for ferrienterochelin and colicin
VKIMIDGRPSGLDGSNRSAILESIPANEVESIELVTNPSAKYEAEGSSGIINIILKKSQNTGFGYNGTAGLNFGTGDKYSGQFNLSLKNNKVNIYGNYNYNSRQFTSSGFDQRYNYISNNSYFVDVNNSGRRKMQNHMVKLGLDYYIDKQNTLGLSFAFRDSKRGRSDLGTTMEYDPSGTMTSHYYNTVNSDDDGLNFDINANYVLRFKKPQQVLSTEFSISRDKDEDFTNTFETYYYPVNTEPPNRNEIEYEIDDSYSAQADYVHPFSKDIKLESGYKGTYKKKDDDFTAEDFNYGLNQFETDYSTSNRFIYKEQVHGLYAIYTHQIGSFGFSLGGRAEVTVVNGELVNPSEIFDKNYINFFPSASISQKLSKTAELQLSYSRRINRPRTRQLNPFVTVSMMGGSNSLTKGNPDLNPEFSDSYEFSYIHYLPFATITPSIFYRKTKDEISRSIQLIDSVTTLTSFVNYNSSLSYGGELLVNAQPFKIWSLNGTISYYKSEVDASNYGSQYVNEGYSWSARATTGLQLPEDFGIQLTYMYHGKRYSAQGTFDPMQMLDAGVKKDLFDKKLNITLRVSDILNTGKFSANVFGENFSQVFERARDSRALFLNITYKFGQQDKKTERRKKNENDDNNGDDGFDF